jgi:hypothetical protein
MTCAKELQEDNLLHQYSSAELQEHILKSKQRFDRITYYGHINYIRFQAKEWMTL